MLNETRKKFNAFLANQAHINGVSSATQSFAVEPLAEQRLFEKVQESSAFLRLINNPIVPQQIGEKVGIGITGPIASRTDTSDGETIRKTKSVSSLSKENYICTQTNYDTHLRYSLLDSWRHKPNFPFLIRAATIKRIALDRLSIGWNGKSVAANTDLAANPLLQDVNEGWLQHIRDNKPSNVLSDAKIYSGGDYNNIDAAVYDAKKNMIASWYQEAELVVICGTKLLSNKYVKLINSNEPATERSALESLMVNEKLGFLPTITVPYFPDNAFLITPLANLSIYTQEGSTRLRYEDQPAYDRVAEYRSVNEDYVIEDYDAVALYENIVTEAP